MGGRELLSLHHFASLVLLVPSPHPNFSFTCSTVFILTPCFLHFPFLFSPLSLWSEQVALMVLGCWQDSTHTAWLLLKRSVGWNTCVCKLIYKGRCEVQPLSRNRATTTYEDDYLEMVSLLFIKCGNGEMRTEVTFYHWKKSGHKAQESDLIILYNKIQKWECPLRGMSASCPFHYFTQFLQTFYYPASCRSTSCLDWQRSECHQFAELMPLVNSHIMPLLHRFQVISQHIVRILA